MASAAITALLRRYREGDAEALEELIPLVYPELRALARSRLRHERAATIEPTALVHEAFIRLTDQQDRGFENRRHFYFFASHLMRQILVDHARSRLAKKRGGEVERITLEEAAGAPVEHRIDVLLLDQMLTRLAAVDERKAKAVELRYFGGMSLEEIAATLDASERTVSRDIRVAMAWLNREMSGPLAPDSLAE
ncbi:MAG: ECF-type sigma factor [Bryobacteraceae bacterium]